MKKLLLSASFFTIIVMILNFGFKIYLSYKINKDEIGVFYTFIDFVSIGVMMFSGYKDSLVRAYDKKGFEKVTYWYLFSFFILFFIVLFFEIIFYNFSNFDYSVYFLVSLFFLNTLSIFLSYFVSAHKIYKVMLFENFILAVGLIVGFFIFNFFMDGIESLIFAFIISFLFKIVYLLYFSKVKFVMQKSKVSEQKEFFKNVLLSGFTYFVSGFFVGMSSLLVLYFFNDKIFLADYQIVIKSVFFSLVAVFVYPLNSFTFPQVSKLISEQKKDELFRINKLLVKYLVVLFFLLFVSTFFTKFIIGLVFPKEYMQSYKMLNLLLPLLPFIAYTTFALNIIKGYDRFDLALYVRFFGSLMFFVSVYIFYILGFDAKSIVYSLDISFFVMFLLAYFYKRKVLS